MGNWASRQACRRCQTPRPPTAAGAAAASAGPHSQTASAASPAAAGAGGKPVRMDTATACGEPDPKDLEQRR
eukprot:6286970-Lingulodinium_polyedra.AAC.1